LSLSEINDIFISKFEENLTYNNNQFIPLFIFDKPLSLIKIENILEENNFNKNNDFINFKLRENFICIYNNLLFNSKQMEYLEFKQKNINNFLKYKIKPDLMIETLMQTNLLINYIIDKIKSPIIQIKEDFFNLHSQKRVLYFFKEDNSAKCYRKRLLTLSTKNVKYIPFITRTIQENTFNEELFELIYGERIDILLQREPYFYLESQINKDFCHNLENYLTNKNKNFLKMSSFNIMEKLFLRFNCYLFLEEFISKNSQNFFKEIKENLNISIEVPFSIQYNINNEKLIFFENLKNNFDSLNNDYITDINNLQNQIHSDILNLMLENNLNFPIIIKPDQCEVHEMMLILSEKGLCKFTALENLKKTFINKNFILQRFINHDGLMFKNFFINKKSYTFIRPSLPNLEGKNLNLNHFKDDSFTFKNEFLYQKEDESFWENIENIGEKMLCNQINYDLIDSISKKFAEDTQINLFGLDYLFDRVNNKYYLLECNYFPSYRELKDKLAEEFESHMVSYHIEYKNNKK
jgi:inositol-1,3,4-trisphosphate 5/6-kinase/inositol-tetrakisphosphate 1-kinase